MIMTLILTCWCPACSSLHSVSTRCGPGEGEGGVAGGVAGTNSSPAPPAGDSAEPAQL